MYFSDISENPLACDCQLIWLPEWAKENGIKLKPPPRCGNPFKGQPLKKIKIGSDLKCTTPLQEPIVLLELKPDIQQLIFEGDSLFLNCRAPRIKSGYAMRDSEDFSTRANIFWGWSEKIRNPDSMDDIIYHNPKLKFPSVLIDERHFSDSGMLNSILKIPYVTRNHSGEFECRLVSQHANLSKSVSVLVISDKTKYCFSENTNTPNKGDFSWPRTIRGNVVSLPCTVEGVASSFATRKCNDLGQWENVVTLNCPYIRESTRILEQFAKVNLTLFSRGVLESARRLKNFTHIDSRQTFKKFQDPIDVVFVGKTVHNYLDYISVEKELGSIIIDIVSQVMEHVSKKVLEEAQKMDGTCKKLIEAAEVAASYTTSSDSQKNNLAIELFKIPIDVSVGITCAWLKTEHSRVFQCNTASKSLAFHEKNIEASIQFPATQATSSQSQHHRLLVSVYQNNKFFPQHRNISSNYLITSNIIGAKLISSSTSQSQQVYSNSKNLSDPIFIVLKAAPFHNDISLPKAVWWDTEMNDGLGGWSFNQGCHSSHYLGGVLVFVCNKLGFYGLVQHTSYLNDFPLDENAGRRFRFSPLGFYVGAIILWMCLWIQIITYCFHDQIQMGRRIKHSLVNTWLAISLLSFVFVIGIYQTEDHKICQLFGVTIHYLSLSVLLWICVSVSHMYKRVSRNDRISMESDEIPRDSEEPRMKKPILGLYLVGYGIGVLICGINSAVNYKEYASYNHCFMDSSSELGALYVPALILLFFLMIMFICIRFHLRNRIICQTHMSEGTQATENMEIDLLESNNVIVQTRSVRSMRSLSMKTELTSSLEDFEHSPRSQMKSFIILLVLYLTTWISAALAVATPFSERLIYEEEVFSITFAISASVLGFFVLFYYGIARSDVRCAWSRVQCYGRHSSKVIMLKDRFEDCGAGGSVFYHQPMNLSRSNSQCSKQIRPISIGSNRLKSAIDLHHNEAHGNGGNFMKTMSKQSSVYGENSSESFYNPNQSNAARRFFKKQKRLQKLNNIDVQRRNDYNDASSDISSTILSYSKPVSEMFGTSSKVNNTNIHVDNNKGNNCKTKYSNPNILSDSCNESELFMDICQEGLRFSTLKSKVNNTDAKVANIYTNFPETQSPVHEIVTMRADDKFKAIPEVCEQREENNLDISADKNCNSAPLYVNARNIMDGLCIEGKLNNDANDLEIY